MQRKYYGFWMGALVASITFACAARAQGISGEFVVSPTSTTQADFRLI